MQLHHIPIEWHGHQVAKFNYDVMAACQKSWLRLLHYILDVLDIIFGVCSSFYVINITFKHF